MEEWEKIQPKSVTYHDSTNFTKSVRTYTVLEPGQWTSLIHDHVHEKTKIYCKLMYKRAKIYTEGAHYLVIDGSCNSCHSKFKGLMDKKPVSNTRAILHCTYDGDFKTCTSEGKRMLTGLSKTKILNQLINMYESPLYICRTEANRLMDFEDKEPCHLPTLNAMRVLKSKTIKKNSFMVILLVAYSNEYISAVCKTNQHSSDLY